MPTIVQLSYRFQCPRCGAPKELDCLVLPAMKDTSSVPHDERYQLGKKLRDEINNEDLVT